LSSQKIAELSRPKDSTKNKNGYICKTTELTQGQASTPKPLDQGQTSKDQNLQKGVLNGFTTKTWSRLTGWRITSQVRSSMVLRGATKMGGNLGELQWNLVWMLFLKCLVKLWIFDRSSCDIAWCGKSSGFYVGLLS